MTLRLQPYLQSPICGYTCYTPSNKTLGIQMLIMETLSSLSYLNDTNNDRPS